MPNDSRTRGDAAETDASVQERRVTAWIGKSLKIEGNIVSEDNLTIDGNVEGTIAVGNNSLTVGAGATVKADLTARMIAISGTVIGNVSAHELLDLRSTGSIVGAIKAGRLRMADGAVVVGPVDATGSRSKAPA